MAKNVLRQKRESLKPRDKSWKKTYAAGFRIPGGKPSEIVLASLPMLNRRLPVLDLGCGNGRNSLFLAKKGFGIDAIDVVDLGFLKKVPLDIKNRISFLCEDVLRSDFRGKKYGFVLLSRLIQYLPPQKLSELISKLGKSTSNGGVVALSYVLSGSRITEKYGVKRYCHSPAFVIKLLSNSGIHILDYTQKTVESTVRSLKGELEVVNIIARKT